MYSNSWPESIERFDHWRASPKAGYKRFNIDRFSPKKIEDGKVIRLYVLWIKYEEELFMNNLKEKNF